MTTQQAVHEAAAKGFQVAGEAYERGRPEYPKEAVDHLIEVLDLQPGRTVADLGAGTGKFTKLLVTSGATVIAVEPVEGMRRKFASLLPQIQILDGTAESMPLQDRSADTVIAAQAFHWFNGDKALAEIHRVLKPGGELGLIWNARDESLDWVAKLTTIIDPHEGGAPRYKSGRWREAFERSTLFSPLQDEHFRYVQRGTYDTIVDRVGSISFISALPESARQKVLKEVRDLLSNHPQTRGQSEVELPYRTDVYWSTKK